MRFRRTMAMTCVLAGVAVASATPAFAQSGHPTTRHTAARLAVARPTAGVGAEAGVPATGTAPQRVVAPGRTADVTGTVLRLDDEDSGAAGTLLRTATGFVPLTGDVANRLTNGAKVTLRVSASIANPAAVQVEEVLGSAARTLAAPTGGSRVQHLKVALVAPKGTSPGDYSVADVRAAIGKASTYWSSVTNGQVSFVVDTVADWTSSPYGCGDFTSIWSAAANATGYTGAPAEHVLTVFPRSAGSAANGCAYGKGTIGADASSSGAAYVADISQSVIAHELGHNMGFDHANARYGTASAPDPGTTGGTYVPYGDVFDVMGWSDAQDAIGTGALDVVHRDQQPALFPGQVQTVTAAANVTLQAVGSTATPAVKGVKVVDGSDVYYLEYRANVGTDARVFASPYAPAAGVRVLRKDTTSPYNASVVLDPTPTGSTRDWNQVIPVGATFTTASGRLRFTVGSAVGENATVAVTFGATTPTPAPTAAAPAAPTGLTAILDGGSAALTWTAPVGGPAVTGYRVNVTSGTTVVWTGTSTTTSTRTPALPAGSYTYTVTASNGAGTSAASAPKAFTVAPAPVAPGAVTLTGSGTGDRSLWVSFTPPAAVAGVPVTGYQVTISSGGTVLQTGTMAANVGKVTVDGLVNGRSYTVGVKARNQYGFGTETTSAALVPRTVPGQVAGVTAVRTGPNVALAWKAPVDGGAPITGYTVAVQRDGVVQRSVSVTATSASYPVEAKHQYVFTVTATSAAGTGRASATVTVVVPATGR
ncbi:M57 family metalloprotease [Kineococcus sp. R86509]|uniref:M57 family metalloprotease n=1 Tax=Kineococcus sp. R86509 TaxID=3093851 RepID=UPI0036D2EE0E